MGHDLLYPISMRFWNDYAPQDLLKTSVTHICPRGLKKVKP